MEDNLYTLALSHYQKGEYEEAFYLLKVSDREETFSNKERVLLEACKKQISDQYYLLITNHIAQQEYDKAIKLQKNFLEKLWTRPLRRHAPTMTCPEKSWK